MYSTTTTKNCHSIFESKSNSISHFHIHKLGITFSVDIQALKKRPPRSLETSGKKHPLTKYNTAEEWRSQLLCFKSIKTCINKVQCCYALNSYINLNLLLNYCLKSSFESSFMVFFMIILWVCELENMFPTHHNSWGKEWLWTPKMHKI